jgi:hypothetical protein
VYGPALQEVTSLANLNTSSAAFYALFSGQKKELVNPGVWLWTDVRNVAQAHVAAFVSTSKGFKYLKASLKTMNPMAGKT